MCASNSGMFIGSFEDGLMASQGIRSFSIFYLTASASALAPKAFADWSVLMPFRF